MLRDSGYVGDQAAFERLSMGIFCATRDAAEALLLGVESQV
jgi:hypothetical protein